MNRISRRCARRSEDWKRSAHESHTERLPVRAKLIPIHTFCFVLAIACAAPAWGQDRPGADRPQRDPPQRRTVAQDSARPGQPATEPFDPEFRTGPRDVFARLPFGPAAADRGPLSDEELDELQPFLEEHLPMLARVFHRMQTSNRNDLREDVDQIAPYIRFLHRTSIENPRRARILIEHVRSGFILERARRAIANPGRGPVIRERLLNEVRGAAMRSVHAEMRLLHEYAQELMDWLDERTEEEWAAVTADGADISDRPERIREFVQRRSEASESQRQRLDRELRAAIGDDLRRQIRAWRTRAEELRRDADAEIDRRVEEVLGPQDRPAPPPASRNAPKR